MFFYFKNIPKKHQTRIDNSILARTLTALAAVGILILAGCGGQTPTSLRLLQPGSGSVYIDGWDQGAKEGDRALVEQKPSGLWVVPLNADYRTTKQGEFTVEIVLDPMRGYVVVNMNDVKVGRDHDNCLAEDELYALMDATGLNFEPVRPGDDSNDDCVLGVKKE